MQLPILLVILSMAAVALAKPAESEASQLAVRQGASPSSTLVASGYYRSDSTTLAGWGVNFPNRRIDGFEVFNVEGIRITLIESGVHGFDLLLGLVTIPSPGGIFFEYRFYGEWLWHPSGTGEDQLLSEEPRIEEIYRE